MKKISGTKSRVSNGKKIWLAAGMASAFTVGAAQVSHAQSATPPATNSSNLPLNNPQSNFTNTQNGAPANQKQNVFAAPPKPQLNSFEDWFYNSPNMTGDWGGLRSRLIKDGINISATYAGQLGHVLSGGKHAGGTSYDQTLTIGADWDLNRLIGWKGAILHTYLDSRAGGGHGFSTDNTGTKIQPNGGYGAGENFRLYNFSLEQKLAHDRVDLLGGFYAIANEFAYQPILASVGFVANVFATHPQILSQDNGYNANFYAEWGGRIKVYPIPSLYIETGAWDVNPAYTPNNQGFNFSLHGSTGAMVPVEIGYTSSFGPNKLVGHYKIGGIYDTTEVKDVEYTTINRYGRYAGWFMFDQQVWKQSPKSTRSAFIFGEYSLADKRTALEDYIWNIGVSFQGLIPQRPLDNFNIGFANAHTNSRIVDADERALAKAKNTNPFPDAEKDLEISYNIQVNKWLAVTPDFQYLWGVITPSSTNTTASTKHYPNAALISAQVRIRF